MRRVFSRATLAWDGNELDFTTREDHELGYFHILTALKGFYDGAEVKGDVVERAWGHGSYVHRRFRGSRPITLEATLVYDSDVQRHHASNELASVLGEGLEGVLTVDVDGVGPLSCSVFLDGQPQHRFVDDRYAIAVQIPMVSPDPWRYGHSRTSQIYPAGFGEGLEYRLFSGPAGVLSYGNSVPSSKVVLHNAGTQRSYPVFTVRNDFASGFTLIGDGRTVEFQGPVYPQSPVVVDMRGKATQSGQDVSHLLTRREFFSIPPGGSLQPRIISRQPGNGWADITHSDTYF